MKIIMRTSAIAMSVAGTPGPSYQITRSWVSHLNSGRAKAFGANGHWSQWYERFDINRSWAMGRIHSQ